MAYATINTIGRVGIRCFPVVVEVDVSPGLPAFHIVGLPDIVVKEAKERIRSAIKNSGYTFPLSRITVNLAPADIKKDGVGFDLPIAVGILVASESLPAVPARDYFYGELGLQGELKSTRGVLSCALQSKQAEHLYIPLANKVEGSLANERKNVYGISTLTQLGQVLKQEQGVSHVGRFDFSSLVSKSSDYDFADIYGQAAAKRALEIAAAGHHNILLSGSPGSGKTLLARSLPSIMPPLTPPELRETIQIYSLAGLMQEQDGLKIDRPFRSPHSSASLAALVGGSNPPRPGEITLAHNGVLFLDEFAELPRHIIEALRQPLEDKVITVARAGFTAEYPAHSLLIAAINPCPCGYRDDPKQSCTCSPLQLLQYRKKLSGPILDRIDMYITVPPVPVLDLTRPSKSESSHTIRQRVIRAREVQQERYAEIGLQLNSQLRNKQLPLYCTPSEEGQRILGRAVITLNLSARSYHKVLKLARTIADLDGLEIISSNAIAEALQYRSPAVSL